MRLILTGGGSGGHVSPALAVAKELASRHPDLQLLYIGGTLTMEGSTGPSIEQVMVERVGGIPFQAISAGKLKRDGLSLTTLKRLWGVVPGFWQAFKLVKQFKPDVVFSSGGYVSVPVVLAAWLQHIPLVIHEQTAAVGLANSIAAKVATKIAITFPQSATYFPAAKTILTGNPVNQEVIQPDLQIKKTDLGHWLYPDSKAKLKPLIYITGGGQGSHKMNLAIEESLGNLLTQYRLVHQTGDNQHYADFPRLQQQAQQLEPSLQANYYPVKHLSPAEIGHLYQQSALIIARAGANTVLEVAHWAKPAIFIPIPWVTHQEQDKNAQALVEAGTALILPEADLSADSLAQAITTQLNLQPTPTVIAKAQKLANPQAAKHLADIITQVASRL